MILKKTLEVVMMSSDRCYIFDKVLDPCAGHDLDRQNQLLSDCVILCQSRGVIVQLGRSNLTKYVAYIVAGSVGVKGHWYETAT